MALSRFSGATDGSAGLGLAAPSAAPSASPFARRAVTGRARLWRVALVVALVVALHGLLFALLHWTLQREPSPSQSVVTAQLLSPLRPPETPQPERLKPEPSNTKAPEASTSPSVKIPALAPMPPAEPLPMSAPSTAPVATAPIHAPAAVQAPAASSVASVAPSAPVAAVSPPRAPVVVSAVVRGDSCSKPPYPAASERLREEGTVVLGFLISETGLVIDSRIDKSSGYERLDQAARKGLSLCKFKPATVDGRPRQEWAQLRYRWEIEN